MLYGGPDFILHYKFSALLHNVYVAFTFGIFVPILIPIMFVAIFNQYVTEKLQLAYICKQPPQLDENLTREAIMLLKYAPLFMLSFGYWALSNRQYFFNEPELVSMLSNKVPN